MIWKARAFPSTGFPKKLTIKLKLLCYEL